MPFFHSHYESYPFPHLTRNILIDVRELYCGAENRTKDTNTTRSHYPWQRAVDTNV